MRSESGLATLTITIILMTAAVLIMAYTASFTIMQQRTTTNQNSSTQALEAAEAGLAFGIAYLTTNSGTITGSASGGYINYGLGNSSLTNVSLTNNSTFSVVFTNPTQNSYQLIQVTSTGTSADGTSTRVIGEQVYSTSSLTYAITTQGAFTASGTGTITAANAIDAGGAINTSGWTVAGTKTPNDTSLTSQTGAQLFNKILGASEATIQSESTVYSPASVPWGSLSGKVWVNGSAVLAGNYTIGTPTNPVLLVINGNYVTAGTTTVYGIVYVLGTTTTSGTFNVNGAIVSQGSITASGTMTFNSSIVQQLAGGGGSYNKIPGSWKDF